MKLWLIDDVEKAEASPEWKEAFAKIELRRERIRKKNELSPEEAERLRIEQEARERECLEAEQKMEAEWSDRLPVAIDEITVEDMPLSDIYSNSLRAKEEWVNENSRYYHSFDYASGETRERWMVNYIRHELTDYDYYVDQIPEFLKEKIFYIPFHNAVLDKISEKYPSLKEECERQKKISNLY